MNETEIIEVAREALMLCLVISAPILLIGLVIGVTVALFQALTQIQEMTLVFVPKIMAIFLALFFFLPWIMRTLIAFTESMADHMIGLG
jgi:flagellar biosynthetic protein FliQ